MHCESVVLLSLVTVSLVLRPCPAFLFALGGEEGQCYRADVQQCLQKAFHAMRIDTKRGVKYPGEMSGQMEPSPNTTRSVRSHRDSPRAYMTKSRHLCAANRPYLSCFNIPGCRDDYVAHVASVVFHSIHGRVHPIQMFLAHRGYALQLCSQSCSRESRHHCQRMMTANQQNEEHGIYLELVGISKQLSTASPTASKNWGICHRFKTSLASLVRYRSRLCGEAAKCVCMDANIHSGVVYCNAGCEHILDEMADFDVTSQYPSAAPSPPARLLFFLLMLRLFVP